MSSERPDRYPPTDQERIFMLEVRVTELHRQLEAERAELLSVKTIQDSTGKRINTAEAWGRAVIWTTIALGGVATQFTEIVTWFKR